MLKAGRAQLAGSRSFALAYARPGTATPSPSLHDAKGPPAGPQPSLYPRLGVSREEEGPRRARSSALAGLLPGQPLSIPPPPLQRALGAKTLPGARGGLGGCACSLGRLKGKFMLSLPASRGNTVSLLPVGRCIYSSRGFSLGTTWGQRGPPPPMLQAKLSLTSILHHCALDQEGFRLPPLPRGQGVSN